MRVQVQAGRRDRVSLLARAPMRAIHDLRAATAVHLEAIVAKVLGEHVHRRTLVGEESLAAELHRLDREGRMLCPDWLSGGDGIVGAAGGESE